MKTFIGAILYGGGMSFLIPPTWVWWQAVIFALVTYCGLYLVICGLIAEKESWYRKEKLK